jgi:hypothetical protein
MMIFAAAACLVVASSGTTTFRMHKVVSSHMVLQAEKPSIFGFGAAGAAVTATLGTETKKTTVSGDGKWTVQLGPRPASALAGPGVNISVTDGKDTILLTDIVFGDGWVCR